MSLYVCQNPWNCTSQSVTLKLETVVHNNVSILFIHCNKRITLMQGVNNRGNGAWERGERQCSGCMELYVLSVQLSVNLKLYF